MFSAANLKKIPVVLIACVLCLGCITACSSGNTAEQEKSSSVRIGTMPNEHLLPAWVAENDGLFEEAGLDVEILSFDSAQALSAAIAAGQIDMAMVDIPRAVKLAESGTPVDIEWITLGTEPGQGHFGVAAAADAPYNNLQELEAAALSGKLESGVGIAANTVPEYVYEKLCERAGVDPSQIPTEEVASLPERYSLMASGKLAAAALPGSMMELAKSSGLKILADEADGANLSQSVMIATAKFAAENGEVIQTVAEVWDEGVDALAADQSKYRFLLAEKANINNEILDSYTINSYPYAIVDGRLDHPSSAIVDEQIAWMKSKGYSSKDVSYDQDTGAITVS